MASLTTLAHPPRFLYFATPAERELPFSRGATDALARHGYRYQNRSGMTAEEAPSWSPAGLRFSARAKRSVVGNFLIHASSWARQRPGEGAVVVVEADTYPVRPWTVPPSLFAEWDLLIAHSHDGVRHKGCLDAARRCCRVLPGFGNHSFASGAVLFTNRRPLPLRALFADERCAKGGELSLGIDEWIACADRHAVGGLKVGQLCPPPFHQGQSHCARAMANGAEDAASWCAAAG